MTLAQAEHATEVASRAATARSVSLTIVYMASAAELNVFPQLQMLRDGQIHAGLLRLRASDRPLTVNPIVREPLVIVLPERHPLARRRSPTLPALRDERFIPFSRRFAPEYYDTLIRSDTAHRGRPAVHRARLSGAR